MHQKETKNREWVKSAAIIFLLILLVLTFFSNTIMNRTLTEVASTGVTSGTITQKVRGTGTVTAVGNTTIKAPSTRYIATVKVKEGQEVSAGDVLFVLGAGEGEELENAQDNLDSLQFSLQRAQASYPTYYGSASLMSAQQNLDQAAYDYQRLLEIQASQEQHNKDIEDARKFLDAVKTEYQVLKAERTSRENIAYQLLCDAENAYYMSIGTPDEEQKKFEYDQAIADYQNVLTESGNFLNAKQREVDNAQELYEYQLQFSSSSVDYDLLTAKQRYDSALASYWAAYESAAAAADSYSKQSAQNYIDVQEYQSKVEKAQKKVDSLSGNGDNEIVAQAPGIVSSIEVAPGQRVEKDTVLAMLEVPSMGYQMSFSVTKDQAKRLKIGDSASISNYYWGSDIIATVSAIKTDKKDPQTKKEIVCDLEGNVTAGSELTVSIGQKSAGYDLIVPNNSVRTDSNGTFVLTLTSKNSPLGNRYFANRVDVEVLASDDVNSAVNGGLNTGDFVITTSSAPIKSGDQVRMAD